MPPKQPHDDPDAMDQLVTIAENYDSKVRLLFQLRNYISLVKYDPQLAKRDRSSEFRRFVTANNLDIWEALQSKADTRKVSKRVQHVKKEVEDQQMELRTQKLKQKRTQAKNDTPLRGAAARAAAASKSAASKSANTSKSASASVPTPAPSNSSNRQKRKAESPHPVSTVSSKGASLSISSNGELEVDPELGWPDEIQRSSSKRVKRSINLITNPLTYVKSQYEGGLAGYLNSFRTITDDIEPISQENWDKKVEADAVAYEVVDSARKSGELARLEEEGIGKEQQMTKFSPPIPSEPSYHENVLNHLIHYSKLQTNLRKYHQSIVKRNTQSIEQYFRRLAGAEDREKKELERQLRQIARRTSQEVMKKWRLAEKVVEQRREAVLAEEKREKGKEYLNQILDKSAKLIESRIEDVDEEDEDNEEDEKSGSEDDEDEEEDMQTYLSDVNDAQLSLEELREKYKNLPEIPESEHEVESENEAEKELNTEEKHETDVEKPSEEALRIYAETKGESEDSEEDSDETSEEDEEEDESEDEEEESEVEAPKSSLAALLGGGTIEDDDDDAEFSDTDVDASAEENTDEPEKPEIPKDSENSDNLDKPNSEVSGDDADMQVEKENTEVKSEIKEESEDADESETMDVEPHTGDTKENSTDGEHHTGLHRIEPPFLLKGHLREYQRNGLDWLAGLVQSGTNGILADEMGLGKTIQTIALLLWLACEHHIWGPHLIVVPTSVMLNWEMEFKRFAPGLKILTYFGTPQQRKRKRRGWNKEDTWHVCITSYQLVIQDQVVFRSKKWQYMVLDEAHNIKNFRSQRWQALLNFNAQHRLLLTGTPLQNNLVELWSLLYFLMPSTRATQMMPAGFASLDDFQEWFAKPVDQMVEEGDEADDEARATISKLHQVLRPYLLRRLKIDVEKQMPGKYEHVVYCRLSKRQRYLYDDFMSRASTRETLASGNFMSILNCLMQLRKVCNHPDLFEVRPVVTSYAIDNHAGRNYGLTIAPKFSFNFGLENWDFLDRRNLVISQFENNSKLSASTENTLANNSQPLVNELNSMLEDFDENADPSFDLNTVQGWAALNLYKRRADRVSRKREAVRLNNMRNSRVPLYGKDGIESLRVFKQPIKGVLDHMEREISMHPIIERFAFVTPAVTILDYPLELLGPVSNHVYNSSSALAPIVKNPLFHEPQVRLSVAFPDKRLLQYDCGKLQKLAILLRERISNGHRCLIFTQMTKVLDILEQFLNLHGWRYLRLDGATRIEQRQALTERFNKDPSIPVFILSTRSGGLGINLTGADTVIFYDSDWNPAMDRQCQDRCHRIGQTRDVHIYRLVSEFTIESNILRRATQKTILDNVVIQEGEFTTEYFSKLSVQDILGNDAGRETAAPTFEELQGSTGGPKRLEAAMAQAEDRDDQVAANLAMNEARMDQEEFSDSNKQPSHNGHATESEEPREQSSQPDAKHIETSTEPFQESLQPVEIGHIDDWMIHALEKYNLYS